MQSENREKQMPLPKFQKMDLSSPLPKPRKGNKPIPQLVRVPKEPKIENINGRSKGAKKAHSFRKGANPYKAEEEKDPTRRTGETNSLLIDFQLTSVPSFIGPG